jgi:hypothetical protein
MLSATDPTRVAWAVDGPDLGRAFQGNQAVVFYDYPEDEAAGSIAHTTKLFLRRFPASKSQTSGEASDGTSGVCSERYDV